MNGDDENADALSILYIIYRGKGRWFDKFTRSTVQLAALNSIRYTAWRRARAAQDKRRGDRERARNVLFRAIIAVGGKEKSR